MKAIMKLKGQTTLYYDYEECEITPYNPKYDYPWVRAKKDYDVLRIGTVYELYHYNDYMEEDDEENQDKVVCVYNHGYIIFNNIKDMWESQWFKEIT